MTEVEQDPTTSPRLVVSVIVTCYNHERFVEQALEAVRAQTYRPVQLIVTDDASTDASADIIHSWLGDNWTGATFIRHQVNIGICRTLNEALAVVTGDFVTIGSADDWMVPERIELLMEAFRVAPPEVGLVHSGVRLVDSDGEELAIVQTEAGSGLSGWVFPQQLAVPRILTPSVMVRRSVYDAVGDFNEDDIVEDYDMWLRVCRAFDVLHVPGALVNFRWHSGNTTTRIHGDPYDRYVADCLRRHLGYSEETDRLIHERLAEYASPDDGSGHERG